MIDDDGHAWTRTHKSPRHNTTRQEKEQDTNKLTTPNPTQRHNPPTKNKNKNRWAAWCPCSWPCTFSPPAGSSLARAAPRGSTQCVAYIHVVWSAWCTMDRGMHRHTYMCPLCVATGHHVVTPTPEPKQPFTRAYPYPSPQIQALIQVREGEYRFVSQRLVTHAEEVAFYDGIRRERGIIQQAFARLLGTCVCTCMYVCVCVVWPLPGCWVRDFGAMGAAY